MDDRPIGIFDSGSGGLSVWQSITSLLPHESTVYVGDHAYAPYSTKTQAFIRKRTLLLLRFLLSKRVKALVVACNTATVAGIEYYRHMVPHVPIIGVVPVIKTAAERTKTGTIAVFSTQFTRRSPYQKALIRTFASDKTCIQLASSRLVVHIEKGVLDDPKILSCIRSALKPMKQMNADVLVLGCTHFPFVQKAIQTVAGEDVLLLNSGEPVARHVRRVLEQESLFGGVATPSHAFFTSGDPHTVSVSMTKLLGKKIEVCQINGIQ